jgi:hypothetical protein
MNCEQLIEEYLLCMKKKPIKNHSETKCKDIFLNVNKCIDAINYFSNNYLLNNNLNICV